MSWAHTPPTVAIIGLGNQGLKHFHSLFQLQGEGELKIVGIADVVQNDFTLKCPFFADYQEMLTQLHPDIVIICTPNFLHYQQTLAALKIGAFVVKEKPLAMTVTEAEHVLAVARQNQRLVFTCQQRRYSFLWQTVAEQIPKLGNLQNFSYSLTLADENYSWYWDEQQGGGVWLNLGWHGVQLIDWLLGPVADIRVWQKWGGLPGWQVQADYLGLAKLKLETDTKGTVFVSSRYPEQEVLRVQGTRGTLSLRGHQLQVWLDGQVSHVWHSPESKQEWYTNQLRAALDVFITGRDSMDLDLRIQKHLEQARYTSKGAHV